MALTCRHTGGENGPSVGLLWRAQAGACWGGGVDAALGLRRPKWPLLFPGLLNLFFYFHSLLSILLQVPMCIYLSANYVYTLRG
jgi:hypothetical protein